MSFTDDVQERGHELFDEHGEMKRTEILEEHRGLLVDAMAITGLLGSTLNVDEALEYIEQAHGTPLKNAWQAQMTFLEMAYTSMDEFENED